MFDVSDPADYARFRAVFDAAGYTEEELAKKFGPVRLPAPAGPELPHFLYRTRAGTPLDTLARLFLLNVPVEESEAARALAPLSLDKWLAAGLLGRTDHAVVGAVRILLFRGLLLAADLVEGPHAREQVMGITSSTTLLADFAVRRPAGDTLDLGTGSGVQALLAARHSARVTATDCSSRCLDFARFNAGLNGMAGIEFLQGDLFAPAGGRQFDLVLMNPPFAITPSTRYRYRDSGLELDGFAQRLVRQAPPFLKPGGFCQFVLDWVHIAGQDWNERLAGWFEGSGCDVWAIRVENRSPAEYAETWVRDTEHVAGEEALRLCQEWIAYYERHGVEAISSGVVAMRRNPETRNWVRIEDGPDATTAFFGDSVLLGCALRDYLERTSDAALLQARLRISPDARLLQQYEPGERGWRAVAAQIRLARGLEYSGNLDLRLLTLVSECDGRRPVGELIGELAARNNTSLLKIAPNCLHLLRQLVERGFLLPEGCGHDKAGGPPAGLR